MINPNSPSTELKISMTRILTNLRESVYDFARVKVRSQAGVCSVGEGRAASVDADGHAADEVARSDCQSTPKQRVSSVVVRSRIEGIAGNRSELRGEDDGHDDTVDRDHFAEDDGDQVLRPYSRGFDTAAEDRDPSDEDSPGSCQSEEVCFGGMTEYQAAPTTERPMQRPMPRSAQA